MSIYSQIAWFPLCGGLTALGLVLSWLTARRRGAAAGLRGAAWSLLPLAAYLTGAIRMLWQMGVAIGSFAVSFVWNPLVWSGLIVLALAVVLFVVSGSLRARRASKSGGPDRSVKAGRQPGQALEPGRSSQPAAKARAATPGDEDFADVADILRKHGIR